MRKAPNGETHIIKDKSVQTIEAGAALILNDNVLKYGVVMVHPELPLFKMFIKIDPETKTLSHHFEKVKPEGPHIKDYAVELVRDEAIITQPPKRELIVPEKG